MVDALFTAKELLVLKYLWTCGGVDFVAGIA